jgi:hypothetical protein
MKAPSVDAAITQCTLFQRQARRQLERGGITRSRLQPLARCVFEKRVRQLVSRRVGEWLGKESRQRS